MDTLIRYLEYFGLVVGGVLLAAWLIIVAFPIAYLEMREMREGWNAFSPGQRTLRLALALAVAIVAMFTLWVWLIAEHHAPPLCAVIGTRPCYWP